MAYPFWHDVLREFFGLKLYLPIPVFGTFVALAFVVGIFVADKEIQRYKKKGVSFEDFDLQNFASLAMFSGIFGAKLFAIFEMPGTFLKDPIGMIFSGGGYTIYGGLICGLVACGLYVKKKGLSIPLLADIFAPTLMLGYGVGRLGCQFSGDGDWGIPANMALKPGWLPEGFWASTYQNNIVGQMIPAPGVYPTPLYEVIMAFLAFAILWAMRRHHQKRGWLFSLYLILNGIERFAIEQIRVNSTYNLFGSVWTQAELIALSFITVGLFGLVYLSTLRRVVTRALGLGVVLWAVSACSLQHRRESLEHEITQDRVEASRLDSSFFV